MCAWLDIDFMDLEKTFRLEDGLPESLWREVFDGEHNVGRKHQQSCCDSHNRRRKDQGLVDNAGYGSYGAVEDVSMEEACYLIGMGAKPLVFMHSILPTRWFDRIMMHAS